MPNQNKPIGQQNILEILKNLVGGYVMNYSPPAITGQLLGGLTAGGNPLTTPVQDIGRNIKAAMAGEAGLKSMKTRASEEADKMTPGQLAETPEVQAAFVLRFHSPSHRRYTWLQYLCKGSVGYNTPDR